MFRLTRTKFCHPSCLSLLRATSRFGLLCYLRFLLFRKCRGVERVGGLCKDSRFPTPLIDPLVTKDMLHPVEFGSVLTGTRKQDRDGSVLASAPREDVGCHHFRGCHNRALQLTDCCFSAQWCVGG